MSEKSIGKIRTRSDTYVGENEKIFCRSCQTDLLYHEITWWSVYENRLAAFGRHRAQPRCALDATRGISTRLQSRRTTREPCLNVSDFQPTLTLLNQESAPVMPLAHVCADRGPDPRSAIEGERLFVGRNVLTRRNRLDNLKARRVTALMKNTKRILGEESLDPKVVKAYDVYRRTAEIYRRTQQALGRTPKYRVTSSSTTTARIQHGTGRSNKAS